MILQRPVPPPCGKQPNGWVLFSACFFVCLTACSAPIAKNSTQQADNLMAASKENGYKLFQIDTEFSGINDVRQRLLEKQPAKLPVASKIDEATAVLDTLPVGPERISLLLRDITLRQLLWILNKSFKIDIGMDEASRNLKMKSDISVKDGDVRTLIRQITQQFDVQLLQTADGGFLVTPMKSKTFYIDPNQQRSAVTAQVGGDLLGATKDAPLKHHKQTIDAFGSSADPLDTLLKAIEPILQEDSEALKTAGRTKASVGVDKVRGIVTVTARPSQIARVTEIFDAYQAISNRQIDIDAQIIELELNDTYQFGIDWSVLGSNVASVLGSSQVSAPAVIGAFGSDIAPTALQFSATTAGGITTGRQSGGGGLIYGKGGLRATVNALRVFGDIQVIASPTVRLRSGTVSSLSVGDVIRYVQSIKSNVVERGTVSTEVVTESLFSGLYFSVGGRVNDQGSIDLFVSPSQNQVDETSLALVDVGSAGKLSLPRLRTKSISNWLSVESGSIVILGGLIDRNVSGQHIGVPGLADMPSPLDSIFGKSTRVSSAKELLVVIRAVAVTQ